MNNDTGTPYSITVPDTDGKMRLWRNTSIATLASGQSATLPVGTLGYEWDSELDNGSRPPGLVRMSTTTLTTSGALLDFGSTYGTGTVTHYLTLYKHTSGARVFGAGTIQWPWGLDANHDRGNTAADPRMQQATVNLLADMSVQPATLQSGLVPASASTDSVAPASTISSPAPGANVPQGSSIVISGTAADTGGVVGGVEVSVDGGTTWHPANGRANWTYSWTPTVSGQVTIKSRAVDDSGNLETPGSGVTVTVAVVSTTCPCSIWAPSATPAIASDSDTGAVNLGVKFTADQSGFITGLRFYKGAGNTGTHTGGLWSSTGTQLATATFANETASGWQQVNFATPVAITANTVYVASYRAPVGRYAADSGYFAASGVDNPPLHALRDGVNGGNGVYAYSASSTFPSSTFQSTNYWVDVVFTTAAATYSIAGTITGGSGATVTLSGAAAATVTADASGNYTFIGLANGSYTVTPTKAGFTFTPANQPVTVNGANVTAVNFTAVTYSIAGTITGGSGATVTLSGAAAATVTADASGNYTFTGLANGSYTVTPTKAGFTFTPVNRAVTVNGANVTAVNFTAQATYSIAGTISPAASGSGATVTLSGAAAATVTADASGNYTFTGLANGSYTVTPTKAGFTFTPANQPVTVNGANVTAVNFTDVSTYSIAGRSAGWQRSDGDAERGGRGNGDRGCQRQLHLHQSGQRQLHGDADQGRIHVYAGQPGGNGERGQRHWGEFHCAEPPIRSRARSARRRAAAERR